MNLKRTLKQYVGFMWIMGLIFLILGIFSLINNHYLIGMIVLIGDSYLLKVLFDLNKEINHLDE